MATTIPIQDLDTSIDPPENSSVNAVVTLLWPYSSSTRQCALLLSERDFRLRARGGQIRVKFSGPAARAVAENRLGIGDEVVLQIGSGKWVRDEGGVAVHIPGRSVGELQFGRGVQLRVQKEGADDLEINVAEDAVDEVEEEKARVQTPPPKRASPPVSASNFRSSFGGSPASAAIYSSPAFVRKAARFNYLDGISRLFEDEWENQDLPRKKARKSLGEVRDWKIVDRTPSPEPSPARSAVGIDVQMEEADREAEEDIEQAGRTKSMSPPTSGLVQEAETQSAVSSLAPAQEGVATPTPAVDESARGHQTADLAAPVLNIPESFTVQADETTASVPQLQLPPSSPSPAREQADDHSLNLVDPSTPRLLPLSSTTLPSTTPQISPLATKNSLGSLSSSEPVNIVDSTQEVEVSSANADAELGDRMPTPPRELEAGAIDHNDLADHGNIPSVESAADVDEAEQVSSDEDVIEVEPAEQIAEQVTEEDAASDAASDEMMDDYDEDEEDDMIMHEDDAEEIFDADALDGEDSGDDESDEDAEMLPTPVENQQSPQQTYEVDESDPELEDSHPIRDAVEVEVVSQPKETTPEPEERQQPTFVPASTLLQTEQTPIKEPATETVVEAESESEAAAPAPAATTPLPKKTSFGLDGTIASTEVTPAAKSTDTPKTTPQSARDRVMKRTLQSLFGLKGTPSPEKEDVPAGGTAAEVSAAIEEVPRIFGHAQEANVQSSNLERESAQVPEADPSEQSVEELRADNDPMPVGEHAELIELDSSSEEDEQIHESVAEPSQLDYTPSKSKVPGLVPQQRNTTQIEVASQTAQDDSSVRVASQVIDHIQDTHVLGEEDVDTAARANSTGQFQEAMGLQEMDTGDTEALAPKEVETSVRADSEAQEHQSLDIFEGLEDIPGNDIVDDMQVDDDKAHQKIIEPLGVPPENVSIEPQLATTTGQTPLTDADLLKIADPKVTDMEMLDAQPDQPLQSGEAERTDTAILSTEQEHVSSPASFQSQILRKDNDVHERMDTDHETRLSPEDGMEEFSPVVLGSLSKRVSDLVSDEAAAVRLRELGSSDVDAANIDEQVLGVSTHGQTLEQQEEETRLSEPDQTPSRPTKQSTVIDLESSPSGLEEFSPVKMQQSTQVEGIITHSEDSEAEKTMTAEDAHSFDSEADACARDRQLQPDFSDDPPVREAEEIAQVEAEQMEQQLMEADAERPALPLTPKLTQSAQAEVHLPHHNDKAQAAISMQPTPLTSQAQQVTHSSANEMSTETREIAQAQEQPQDKSTMSPAQPLPPKTPARKSLRSRLSNVPDVISAWFSPKRSSTALQEMEKSPEVEKATPAEITEKAPTPKIHVDGLSTAHSYFASLSSLDQHLNPSSQQAYSNPGVVDVLAVVTNSTKAPQRAKGGPRDYYTIFQIADSSMPASSRVRVEVFRPWKAVLPAADVGDVVLLRAFVVKSRKRTPYLLSTDASGWCVWRFVEHSKHGADVGDNEDEKPVWARRMSHGDVREEVKGPPVEYGSAEKEQARKLRAWWLARQDVDSEGQVENGHEEDTSAVEL